MSEVSFFKYQGAGNDFIMVDNRQLLLPRIDPERYRRWCNRKFGIGADGVIFIQDAKGYDFEMVYYNADGSEGSMCGNGGRCAVRFATQLGLIKGKTQFLAVDGAHEAQLLPNHWVSLGMIDVHEIKEMGDGYFVNTGSPHHVEVVSGLATYNVEKEGKDIRWQKTYQPGGTNVNFMEISASDALQVRTFERGVETETLACGTGVTACALVWAKKNNKQGKQSVDIKTLGGVLRVSFKADKGRFHHIFLEGPAEMVFSGLIRDNF